MRKRGRDGEMIGLGRVIEIRVLEEIKREVQGGRGMGRAAVNTIETQKNTCKSHIDIA